VCARAIVPVRVCECVFLIFYLLFLLNSNPCQNIGLEKDFEFMHTQLDLFSCVKT
jgi:hypothetical protein